MQVNVMQMQVDVCEYSQHKSSGFSESWFQYIKFGAPDGCLSLTDK